LFYGILESVFNVSIGIQVCRHPIQTDGSYDGIRTYIKVVNELGPNHRTQVWIHQRSIQEKYHQRTVGGIRGFVHRYMTAYGELEYLGIHTTERECADNLLKNFLCEPTTHLVELIRTTYKNSKTPFKDICDHILSHYHEQQWNHDQETLIHPTARCRRVQGTHQENYMIEAEPEDERMVAYGQKRSDDLRVPDAWWKGASEEEQEILRQMRTRIKARLQAHREHPSGPPSPQRDRHHTNIMDAVQAKQTLTYSLGAETDDEDDDPAVAQLDHIEAEMRNVFGGMARTYEHEQVKCNFDFLCS
jgi:hypothetical protein